MKQLIILSLLLLSFNALSKEETLKIAGKFYRFIDNQTFLVSEKCTSTCLALKKTKALKPFRYSLDRDKRYTNHISSYACTEKMGGKALLGVKSNKDMVSVCYFEEDQSMIEMNSLTKQIEKVNKKKY